MCVVIKLRVFTFTASVEQGGLEADLLQVGERLLDGELHAEARVGRHVGQRQQVRRADEEVAVERVDRYTPEQSHTKFTLSNI